MNKELTTKRKLVKHGLSRHLLYKVWESMIARCYKTSSQFYHLYGGRGIKVCSSWKQGIVIFYEWAMDNGYQKGLYLDRKDNNGNYEPSNCRFVTSKINMQNRSDSKYWWVADQKYKSIRDAAKSLGISIRTIKRWCDGFVKNGKLYPPKDRCFSELKYKE